MNDSKSKGSGRRDSQGVSPRNSGTIQATKVKHKNTEGNSKVFSSIDSGGRQKNSVILPPIQGSRNIQVQSIHSLGGGSPDAVEKAASRGDEVVMAPVIDKGKKSEFEATGTSVKNNLPVTNSAAG